MLQSFLIGFPALFAIVNPITGAMIFRSMTADLSLAERRQLARLIAFYALLVMWVALGLGSYVLALFGITVPALRIGGGIVVALFAWQMLHAPENHERNKEQEARAMSGEDLRDMAFYPLTLPFTAGPGTIAVSVALGASHPRGGAALAFFAGLGLAAAAVAALIGVLFAGANRLVDLLGRTGSRAVTRVTAFLLFCVGVQLVITGVTEVAAELSTR